MNQTNMLAQLLRGASKPTLPPGDMDGGALPSEMEEMLGMPGLRDAQQMRQAMGVADGGSPMAQALGLPGLPGLMQQMVGMRGLPGLMKMLGLGGGGLGGGDFLRPRPNEPGISGVDRRGAGATMGVLRQPGGLESMPRYTPGPLPQAPEPTPTGFPVGAGGGGRPPPGRPPGVYPQGNGRAEVVGADGSTQLVDEELLYTDEGASTRQRARIGGGRPTAMAALLRGGGR